MNSSNQKPQQRQPQFARVRNGAIVDEYFGRIVSAHDLEQIAQLDRIFRVKAGPVPECRTGTRFPVFSRSACHIECTRVIRPLESGKINRDRKGQLRRAEERLRQLRIERRQFLFGRLLW